MGATYGEDDETGGSIYGSRTRRVKPTNLLLVQESSSSYSSEQHGYVSSSFLVTLNNMSTYTTVQNDRMTSQHVQWYKRNLTI